METILPSSAQRSERKRSHKSSVEPQKASTVGSTRQNAIDQQHTNDKGISTKRARLDVSPVINRSRSKNVTADAQQVGDAPSVVNLRNSIAVKCNTSTLYVNNLHPRITEAHLEMLFKPYGEIERVFFVRGTGGVRHQKPNNPTHVNKGQLKNTYNVNATPHKGYAFVEFKNVNAAKLGIEKIDGRSLLGKTLYVRPAHSKSNDGRYNSKHEEKAESSSLISKNSDEYRKVRKEKNDIQNKIEALKRAIEEKKPKER